MSFLNKKYIPTNKNTNNTLQNSGVKKYPIIPEK